MAFEDLERLDDDNAFDSVRRFEDLGRYHVAFDSLTGNDDTEAALKRVAEARRSAASSASSAAASQA